MDWCREKSHHLYGWKIGVNRLGKKCLYECILWWFYMSEESDIDDIVEDDFEDDLDEDLDDDTNGVTERR